MRTFMELLAAGEKVDMADCVSDWHRRARSPHGASVGLHEWLGYASWVELKKTSHQILDDRRARSK